MAKLFNGDPGVSDSSYNNETGRFNIATSNNWEPANFGTETAFLQKVDISIPGVMQDCGECHVGGGAMEYVPYSDLAQRVSLRDITTQPVNGGTTIDFGEYTAFNYFVDVYDVDGDLQKYEVLYADYAKLGVLEMDCFLCHLEGYDYAKRIEMQRKMKFDASRAVASGIASENALPWDAAGYGTTVATYLAAATENDGNGSLRLTAAFAANIKESPPSQNCAFCHQGGGFGVGQPSSPNEFSRNVDWKKRGDHWVTNNYNWDVHSGHLDCMDCHQRKPGQAIGTSGSASSNLPGLCDPTKGNAPYSSVWNNNDNTVLTCDYCHGGAGSSLYPAAPNPAAAHAAKGLTALICQDGTMDGLKQKSHIDIIDCSACHVRKLDHYSGGAMVDATGADALGRLADHENKYVERDMYDNLIVTWQNGKLIKSSALVTFFYRDKNDVSFDVNNDTRMGGMDTPLMTHVMKINNDNNWKAISEDEHGNITADELAARFAAFNAGIDTLLGTSGTTKVTRLSSMGVPFKVNHNISPVPAAFGAGGCADCHGPNKGFYNGPYSIKGDLLTLGYNATQITPLTKVNSSTAPSDFHPATKNKANNRSIPVQVLSGGTSPRTLDVSELIYEDTFNTVDTSWKTVITGAPVNSWPNNTTATTKGWLLRLDVCHDTNHNGVCESGETITQHTMIDLPPQLPAGDISGLISNWNALGEPASNICNGDYGFVITNGGGGTYGNLVITAEPGKLVRLNSGIMAIGNAGDMGLGGALYMAAPATSAIDGVTTIAGRTAMVDYLNSIGTPVADISAPASSPASATRGVPVTFTANTTGHAPGTTYRWTFGDGGSSTSASTTHAYATTGQFTARLYVRTPVIDGVGGQQTATDSVVVNVSPPAAQTEASWASPTLFLSNMPMPHTKVYVVWGDGRKTTSLTSTATLNLDHTYYGSGPYNCAIRVYNGNTLIETKTISITL